MIEIFIFSLLVFGSVYTYFEPLTLISRLRNASTALRAANTPTSSVIVSSPLCTTHAKRVLHQSPGESRRTGALAGCGATGPAAQ
jgi:hypothetical protein